MNTKNTAINGAEKVDENITGDDSVTLTFAEADDVIEQEKSPSKIKKALTRVFTTTDDEEKAEKRVRKRQSRFFVKNIHVSIGACLLLLHMLIPQEYKESFFVNDKEYSFLQSHEHLEHILTPLARIADRHTHIADINPDVMDVLASLQASAAYGMELRAAIILKQHLEKKASDEKRKKYEYRPINYEDYRIPFTGESASQDGTH